MTHFVTIPVDESHENLIGYCVQIVNRLFGGVGLVGCYSTNQNENSKVVQACRSYVLEYQSNQSFVSVLFADGKVTTARRHVGMNQTSKSDVKNVPNSKYPLVVLESNVTLSFTLAIGEFTVCGSPSGFSFPKIFFKKVLHQWESNLGPSAGESTLKL